MRHLNPLYVKEKSVVPELVLAVRLLSVYLLLTNEFPFNGNQGGGRFYPVVDVLNSFGTDEEFNLGVRILYLGGIGVLLFTRFVRLGALAVGLAFVIGLLSCQTCISVAHLFTGCIFLCTALSNAATGTDLIRFQLAVLYLGADLNKVFDADWWTGASMETLLVTKHQIRSYMNTARLFPPFFLSQIMGIGVIVLQLGIAMLLINRKTVVFAMLLALVLHLPMVVLMHMTFGPFLFALLVSYGSLLGWPRQLVCVSRLHSKSVVWLLTKLDFNKQLSDCNVDSRESLFRWLRTGIDFLAHPAILLSMTLLTAALVRYGKLVPLVLLVILAFCIYAWPRRRRAPELRPQLN